MYIGDRVAGRFTVTRLAGRGGTSEVFLAHDQLSDQNVAIKVFSGKAAQDQRRFLLEAAALASLQHPSIIRCLSQGETPEGEPYLVLEWLEGEDLASRLERGYLSIEEVISLLLRVAEALSLVHEKGIVHRDLKPQNLFLSGRSLDKLKLIDFGIARLQDTTRGLTHAGTVIGTPGYMSPEQASEETTEFGPASDIFSLGCVAFECLTGRQAFQGETIVAVLAKILFTELAPVKRLRDDTPEGLSDLLARMLQKDPNQRPKDGTELLALLQQLKTPSEPSALSPARYETLTTNEQRLYCVLMIRASLQPTQGATPDEATPAERESGDEWPSVRRDDASVPAKSLATLRAVVSRYSGRIEALSEGALVVVSSGAGIASDQALKAVRCALALRGLLPKAQMALAIDRSEAGHLSAAIDGAARLLPNDKEDCGLWLDDSAAGLVDARFFIERRGARLLLQNPEERREPGRTLLGRPSPYLGRERELSWLAELLEYCVKTSSARCALVTAPAGMGKSRLAQEACQSLAPLHSLEVWQAYGDPLRAGAPFGLLSQMLRRVFSIHDGEPLDRRQQKLRQRVARILSQSKHRRADLTKRANSSATLSGQRPAVSNPADDAQRIAEFLGEIAGVPFPDQDSAFLRSARQDARLMNDQLQAAFLDWLFAELQARPLLLLVDDLHWGDLPSINFLDAALRELKSSPLMVLALSRPEVKEIFPNLWQRRNLEELSLGPLSARMSERVARSVLGSEAPAELIERLVEHAAGNAFYLEELLRSAAEGRVGALPETLLAMSQARLEALPRDTRRVLRAASIFGQRCWQGAIAMLLGDAFSAAALSQCLQELCQQEVLFADGEGAFPAEEEFSFRHTLQREAAYSMLTDEDKTRGHLLAGEWLSQAGEPNAAVLAEHFERGQDAPRAVASYLRAAEQALAGDDLAAALSHAERGLALQPSDAQRGALRILQIEPHIWRNDNAAAEACALEAMEALPKTSTLWYKAAAAILKVSTHLGHFDHFVALIEALQEQAPSPEARAAYVTDTSMIVPYLSFAGMYDVAELFVQKVEAASVDLADREPMVRGWLYMAKSYRATLLKGDPWGFFTMAREAAQGFLQAGDQRNAQVALLNAAVAAKFLGSLEESALLLTRALTNGERLGLPLIATSARHYLALVLALRGDFGEDFVALRQQIEAFVAANQDPLAGTSRLSLAQLYLCLNDLPAAEREARAAAELLLVAPPGRAHALAVLSSVLLRQGKTPEALSSAKEGLEALLSLGSIGEGEGQVMLAYIEAHQAAGLHREAKATLSLARKRLLSRADKIEEPRYRDLFLQVPEHARTLQLFEELSR